MKNGLSVRACDTIFIKDSLNLSVIAYHGGEKIYSTFKDFEPELENWKKNNRRFWPQILVRFLFNTQKIFFKVI